MQQYYTYIMMNERNTVLYIGATRNLEYRVWEHKNRKHKGFTKKYNVTKLVYYEEFEMAMEAVQREKQLKNWHRQWKLNLVRRLNPSLKDLAGSWFERDAESPARLSCR